jgi:hypothetical protein
MDYKILFLYRLTLVILEIIAFLVALSTRKYHNAIFKLFFYNLLFIVILESCGFYTLYYTDYKWILSGEGNVYFPYEITLVYLISLQILSGKIARLSTGIGYAIFIAIWLATMIRNGFFVVPTTTILFGSIFGTIIFLGTLIQMIGTANITRQPLFWISVAMLVFYSCNIPYFGMVNYLATKDSGILKQLMQILFATNYIRYSLTIVSFLLLKKQNQFKPAPLHEYHEQ